MAHIHVCTGYTFGGRRFPAAQENTLIPSRVFPKTQAGAVLQELRSKKPCGLLAVLLLYTLPASTKKRRGRCRNLCPAWIGRA